MTETPVQGGQAPIRKLNRQIVRLAAGALALLLCAACQGGPAPTAAILPTASPTAAPSLATLPPLVSPTPSGVPSLEPTETPEILRFQPADLKGQKVQFWHPLVGESAAQLEALVKEFNQKNEWGIQVTATAQGGSGSLSSALESAKDTELPDAILAPSDQLADWQQTRGLLVDLTPYLDLDSWGMKPDELQGYLPVYWQQDQYQPADGAGGAAQQLGIPALRTAEGLIYNRSFAAELGFTKAPATTADLLEQACAAAKANNKLLATYGTGGWLLDTSSLSALSWMATFGANPAPAKAGDAWHFDQPKALDALHYLRGMQEKGCLWAPKHPIPYEYFGDRKTLFYMASFQDLNPQAGYEKKISSKDDWTMIPFPGSDGKPVLFAYGSSYAVLRAADSPEQPSAARQMAAWLFVRWMSQGDNQVRLALAWGSLPVSKAAQTALSAKSSLFPWNIILGLESAARPAPSDASWSLVRRPLEDAFWQLFNLASADQIPQLLPALDEMVVELQRTQK